MLEWLDRLKGAVNDSFAYDSLKSNVENMQRDNESLRSLGAALESHIKILTANIAEKESQVLEARERLSALMAENARLCKENTHYAESIKFDVIHGVAFERDKNNGKHNPNPRCPNCFKHLGFTPGYTTTDYRCTCGHKVERASSPERLIEYLKGEAFP